MENKRLSFNDITYATTVIDPVFLHTPQYVCEPLGGLLGCELLLKVETQNPIRSFKGRGADFLISELVKHTQSAGKQKIVCASAGNFGQAMAYSCRKHHLPITIFASTKANPLKVKRMRELGAGVILFGDDFDAAKEEARNIAHEEGSRFVEDAQDVETLIGAGTIGLELLSLPQPLDFLLIPLGNGALFNGIATAMKAKSPQIQLIAVQSAGAPAMIESIESGTLVIHETIETIADGIGVRVPVAQALEDMKGLIDKGLLVNEESILQAMKLLHTHAGLVVEPSGAVGVAAILENKALFANKKVGTIICGGNLTEEQLKNWL
jgi:threonine dehydratase